MECTTCLKLLTTFVCVFIIPAVYCQSEDGCQYDRTSGSWSDCYVPANIRRRTLTLLDGPNSCPSSKLLEEPCIGCKYRKGVWGDCDPETNVQSRVLTLKLGPAECEQSKIQTRPCRVKRGAGCRYSKGEWSACVNGKKTRILTRKPRSPDSCEAKKEITKPCNGGAGCKYRKSKGPCNPTTNSRTVTLTLKKGHKKNCEERKIVTRMCKKKMKPGKCNYINSEWSDCHRRTNTMSLTQTLQAGSPPNCVATKLITKKCKKLCKFRKGTWSGCNFSTMLMERTDTLVGGDEEKCEKTRVISKKCKNRKNKKKNKKKKNKRKKKKKNERKMKHLTAPRDLTVVPSEESPLFVRIYWQPPRQMNGQITGYMIFFTNGRIDDPRDWVVETVMGDKLSANIKNLTPNATYLFKVQAKTEGGHGYMSDVVDYKTPVMLN